MLETDSINGAHPALYIVYCWVEFTGNLLDSLTVQNRKSVLSLGNQTKAFKLYGNQDENPF